MARLSLGLLALALAALASCGGGGSAPKGPPALLPLHAEAVEGERGRIVDEAGREVLLRGVNVNAFVDYWSGSPFPTTFPFDEEDARLMASIGWDAVRLLLSWSRVEPEPGSYDEAYLDRIEGAVRLLARHGIYTILDLHQDAFGAALAARPGEVCEAPAEPAIGWDGAPAWATFDDGRERCVTAGIRETSPAVRAAWEAFFSNREGPGGVGIRTRYVRMLAHVAARFAREPSVAGIDLMNEPGAFSPEAEAALSDLYGEALVAIREAERDAEGWPHLVLFEPSALWSAVGRGAPPDFDRDRDVVYAPHIYTGGFTGGPITREAFQIALREAAGFGAAPVLSGEWGTAPSRAGPTGDGYFLDHQALEDELGLSATLWTWRESCGDPHKVAEARAGVAVPVPWGEFEVDCRKNEVLGLREALVDELTRAYPRAAPGRLDRTRYDPATGAFEVRGRAFVGGPELVVFYPAQKHGRPEISAEGLGAVTVQEAPGGGLYLRAPAEGAAWTLRATPRSAGAGSAGSG